MAFWVMPSRPPASERWIRHGKGAEGGPHTARVNLGKMDGADQAAASMSFAGRHCATQSELSA